MRTIKWGISLDGITKYGEIEVEENARRCEIEELAREAAFNHIDWWWEEV